MNRHVSSVTGVVLGAVAALALSLVAMGGAHAQVPGITIDVVGTGTGAAGAGGSPGGSADGSGARHGPGPGSGVDR